MASRVTSDELSDDWSEVFGAEDDPATETTEEEVRESSGFTEDSVRLYLREIGRVKMIKPDEEIELARLIAKGDAQAKKKLIQANLRLVISIAKKYLNKCLEQKDFPYSYSIHNEAKLLLSKLND